MRDGVLLKNILENNQNNDQEESGFDYYKNIKGYKIPPIKNSNFKNKYSNNLNVNPGPGAYNPIDLGELKTAKYAIIGKASRNNFESIYGGKNREPKR